MNSSRWSTLPLKLFQTCCSIHEWYRFACCSANLPSKQQQQQQQQTNKQTNKQTSKHTKQNKNKHNKNKQTTSNNQPNTNTNTKTPPFSVIFLFTFLDSQATLSLENQTWHSCKSFVPRWTRSVCVSISWQQLPREAADARKGRPGKKKKRWLGSGWVRTC